MHYCHSVDDHAATPEAAWPFGGLVKTSLLGALIGVPVGLLAFAFIWLVHELEHWLWHELPARLGAEGPPWYLVVGLPILGGLLVHLARLLPGDGGHSPLHVGHTLAGRPREAGGVALAALASLSFGMVLGPEAPLLALGAAAAAWFTSWAKLDKPGQDMVGAAGSSAALSTLFGGPLVAGLMILESSAGAGLAIAPIMLPALTAASISYVLITGLGGLSGLDVAGLRLGDLPTYNSILLRDLTAAVVVGLVMAGLAFGIRRLADRVAGMETRLGRLPLLLASGLVVGLLALLSSSFGADPLDLLFSGQASIIPLLAAPAAVALVLVIAKALVFAVSLGGGFRGGVVFPAIFIGVGVADVGVLVFDMSPTVAIAMGAAAGTTAMTRMLVSSVLFAGLLVGRAGLDAIPVATIAAVTTWLAVARLDALGVRSAQGEGSGTPPHH